jgi:hypothetical protein
VVVTSNIQVRSEWIPLRTGGVTINPKMPVTFISTLPVLTDFRPLLTQFGQQNSSLLYHNQGEFRWIDLLWDGPIDRLSFSFWWQSSDQ